MKGSDYDEIRRAYERGADIIERTTGRRPTIPERLIPRPVEYANERQAANEIFAIGPSVALKK